MAVLVTAAATALGLAVVVGPTADAAKPEPTLGVTIVTPTPPPTTPGAPAVLLKAGDTFSVTVTLPAKLVSSSKDTAVQLSIDGTTFAGGSTVKSGTILAGASSGTIGGLVIPAAVNKVTLTAEVTDGTNQQLALAPYTTPPFDVVREIVSKDVSAGQKLLISAEGFFPCTPTPEVPTCVDLVLPNGVAVPAGASTATVLFTKGACAGVGCAQDSGVLQVLADFADGVTNKNPATLIYKCDKTLCPGGGIPSYSILGNLAGIGDLAPIPPCSKKGVIQNGVESCVDYVQSKRDGSGDIYLYWLVPYDARMSH